MIAIIIFMILVAVAFFCYGSYRLGRILRSRTPEGKGALGETLVSNELGVSEPGVRYVINNFMFKVGQKSCQIDHIVINKNGVYIIETKNYSGTVFGSDSDKYWTQKIGSKTNSIYSPVKQNAAHVYNLSRVLSKHIYLTSLVVFVQNNTENIRSESVIPLRLLSQSLALPSKIKPYTAKQMEEIYAELESVRNMDITNAEHIMNIRRRQALVDRNICPDCNRPLVTRQGKYGNFLGCSGYPECKYIKR